MQYALPARSPVGHPKEMAIKIPGQTDELTGGKVVGDEPTMIRR
jgi:hypothetical protein